MGSIKVPKRHLVVHPDKIGKPMPANSNKRLKVDAVRFEQELKQLERDDPLFME